MFAFRHVGFTVVGTSSSISASAERDFITLQGDTAVRAFGAGWLEWRWIEKPSEKRFGPYVQYRWRDGVRKRTKYVSKVGSAAR